MTTRIGSIIAGLVGVGAALAGSADAGTGFACFTRGCLVGVTSDDPAACVDSVMASLPFLSNSSPRSGDQTLASLVTMNLVIVPERVCVSPEIEPSSGGGNVCLEAFRVCAFWPKDVAQVIYEDNCFRTLGKHSANDGTPACR